MDSSVLKNTIPITKVASAALLDTYADISMAGVQETYLHWASRGMTKLVNEVLKSNIQKVILPVNRTTKTAVLPVGFKSEVFVGIINHYGQKVSFRLNTSLADEKGVEVTAACEDKCPKCNSNKAVCNDLSITEETSIVVINDATYEKKIVKKLYPDGRYFLETTTPVLNIDTSTVEYSVQKEFVANISLKPCGCVEETQENIDLIRSCRPDIYSCYYAPLCSITLDTGYRIFPETGYIKFDDRFSFDKVYLEYRGVIPKINGQYHIPEVCFETLVEYTKFKAVDGKPNVSNNDKLWRWNRYMTERGNMRKIIGRLSLSKILQLINQLPKFEYDSPLDTGCYPCISTPTSLPASSGDCVMTGVSTSNTVNSKSFIPFEYSGIVGVGDGPVHESISYQNDKFKNALGINAIYIDNQMYTLKKGEFTIDTDDGIIALTNENKFYDTNVLVVPTFFKLI